MRVESVDQISPKINHTNHTNIDISDVCMAIHRGMISAQKFPIYANQIVVRFSLVTSSHRLKIILAPQYAQAVTECSTEATDFCRSRETLQAYLPAGSDFYRYIQPFSNFYRHA